MKRIISCLFLIFLFRNIAYSQNIPNSNIQKEKYVIPKLTLKRKVKDFLAGGAMQSFNKKFYMLSISEDVEDKKIYETLTYKFNDMQNAYNHGYTAAKLTYLVGKKRTLKLGYSKEIKTKEKEIKNFGGKLPAFLDTNCDLWNNQIGIDYAIKGKNENKSFKNLSDDIFYNVISDKSDFIIDYKNDTRRWNDNANENNLWEIVEIQKNEL